MHHRALAERHDDESGAQSAFVRAAKLERILLQIVPDPSTRRIILERGDVDFAMQLATKDISDLAKTAGVKVLSSPGARGWWLGMTWRKAPFNDPHFRRAIAWAMPYDTLLHVVAHGQAQRLRSCVSKHIAGIWRSSGPMKPTQKAREEPAHVQIPAGFAITVPVLQVMPSTKNPWSSSRRVWRATGHEAVAPH